MTKAVVNPGICGYSVTVKAKKKGAKQIRIEIDTDCEMVMKLQEDISVLDARSAFTGHLNNPVYRSAAMHLRHSACPVPAAILKVMEVEFGICLPKDVSIKFKGDE